MVENLSKDGHNLVVYDKNHDNMRNLVDSNRIEGAVGILFVEIS